MLHTTKRKQPLPTTCLTSPPQELTCATKRNSHCLTMTRKRLYPAWVQVIGQLHPELAPMLSQLGGAIVPALNEAGTAIVDAFRTDTRNVYAGAITLTQPLYMGGKIRAYNKITKYAEELARQQHNSGMQEVIPGLLASYFLGQQEKTRGKLPEAITKTGQ